MTLKTDFDIVYIDPPLEEYERRAPGVFISKTWTWEEIASLKIDEVSVHNVIWKNDTQCSSDEGFAHSYFP